MKPIDLIPILAAALSWNAAAAETTDQGHVPGGEPVAAEEEVLTGGELLEQCKASGKNTKAITK